MKTQRFRKTTFSLAIMVLMYVLTGCLGKYALKNYEYKTQVIKKGNKVIKIETQKNVFSFYELEGEIENFLGKMEYDETRKSWKVITTTRSVELARAKTDDPGILEELDPLKMKILYSTLTNQVTPGGF